MLKKITILFAFIAFAFQANSTHILGGEVYYNYLGNNNYEFVLTLYRDATGINMPGTNNLSVTGVPGMQNISVNLDTNYSLNTCMFNIELYRYKGTATITSIPATGVTVTWESCCRSNTNNNLVSPGGQSFTIEAEMYPITGTTNSSSSPRFFETVLNAYAGKTNVLNTAAFDPNPHDSMYVELVNVKGNGSPLAYAAGYSATQPFGNSVPTSIDHLTGLITVTNPFALGGYTVGIKASSYRGGQLLGSSSRDLPVIVANANLQDSIPAVSIANLVSTGNVTISGNAMHVEMQPFDTLGFTLNGQTLSLDTLSLDGEGRLLSASAGTSGNCAGPNCATFSSPNGFSGLFFVNGNFSFAPDTSIFFPSMTKYMSTVNLSVTKNNSCGGTIVVPFTIHITVKNLASIWSVSALSGCAGDSVQATINGDVSNLIWSPTTGVSNPTSASPYLSATTPTTYTVTNLNDNVSITIDYVLDSLAKASLIDNSTWAYLPNLNDYDLVVWYYNGVALSVGVDSFALPLPGHYFVYVESGACTGFSDTIIRVNKNQIPAFDASANTTVNVDGNARLTFEIQGASNTLTSLTLAAPDETVFKTAQVPMISVLDDNQTVLATGLGSPVSSGFYELDSLNLALSPNKTYHIEVAMQAGTTIFNKPNAFPYVEDEGIIKVTAASYIDNGTLMNDAFPNFIFGLANGIGEKEFDAASEMLVYPNPAHGLLRIKTTENALFTLMDATGKTVLVKQVDDNSEINISDLPRGLYIYKLDTGSTVKNGRLILQ